MWMCSYGCWKEGINEGREHERKKEEKRENKTGNKKGGGEKQLILIVYNFT